MPEILWVWDYICYSITALDRSWGLQEFSKQLADEDV